MSRRRRSQRGSAIAEFGGALLIFVCFFLMPVIDISFIPVRYLITNGIVNEVSHRLCLMEKRSGAYNLLTTDEWWRSFLNKCGVTVHEPTLSLIICGQDPTEKIIVNQGETIPSNWLPGGNKGPCIYSLELSLIADVPPLVHGSAGLPGFTSPLEIGFKSRSQWESLGRDPQTGEFYINE
jgi:hypothetical protein